MASPVVSRIVKEALWLLGLLLAGFVFVFFIGISLPLKGEGASVSALTVLCFFCVVVLAG